MTLEPFGAGDNDDDYEDEDVPEASAGASQPRVTIESFTGATVERLTRVGYVVASRKLRSKQDREDAVQQAFARVLAAARRGADRPRNADAYFAQTVLRVILDKWKRELAVKRGLGRVDLGIDETVQVEDPSPRPPELVQNMELRRRILACIKILPPAHRAVVELALDIDSGDFNRMSHAEIANRLSLDPKLVKSRLYEAKRKLAACLAGWREEE